MNRNDASEHRPSGSLTAGLLRWLTQVPGPSGHESRAAGLVARILEPLADRTVVDTVGSVVAHKRPNAPRPAGKKVLLAAHLDEIGLLVTGIEKGGYLRFTQVGGFDARVLLGQEVLVHPASRPGRDLPGIIGSKPPHFQSPQEQESVIPMHDLYIDIGMSGARVRSLVRVGDAVTIRGPLAELLGGRYAGKAMDDRACLAAMVRAVQMLGRITHSWDVYAVATAQEEAGLGFLGAASSAFSIRPDLALALDVTHADMPQAPEHKTFALAKGPAVAVGPNVHPAVADRLREIARREEMPFQLEPLPGSGGTDAADIQISGAGIPTGLLGVPVRYMHTPVETVAAADIERLARLLALFIAELDTLDLSWRD